MNNTMNITENFSGALTASNKTMHFLNGKLHRTDGPAIEWGNSGHKEWCLNGKRHREDGPAIEYTDGRKEYYLNNKLHRTDGPAIISNNTSEYYLNNKLHRTDGPAVTTIQDDKLWYQHGNLHREYGPAIESSNGNKKYYLNNLLHRTDGPAVILIHGPHQGPYSDTHNCGVFHKNHQEYNECNIPYLAWFIHGVLQNIH